jgi:hypothetical protein
VRVQVFTEVILKISLPCDGIVKVKSNAVPLQALRVLGG